MGMYQLRRLNKFFGQLEGKKKNTYIYKIYNAQKFRYSFNLNNVVFVRYWKKNFIDQNRA